MPAPLPAFLTVELPSGRTLQVTLRRHPRYRNLRLTVERGGARLSAPSGTGLRTMRSFLQGHRAWLDEHLPEQSEPRLPAGLKLRALGEEWQVQQSPEARTLLANDGLLTLPQDPTRRGIQRLKRWLARRSRRELGAWLELLSRETGLRYSGLSIRGQTRRWGSYSSTGSVSLNWKLLFLPPELCRYVLLHELCHSLHMNHSPSYWTALAGFEPDLQRLRRQMRTASSYVPDWAARHQP